MSRRTRSDGGVTYQVRWRQDGVPQFESFELLRKAEAFRVMVEEAGNRRPEGWVKGHGFVSLQEEVEVVGTPTVDEMLCR